MKKSKSIVTVMFGFLMYVSAMPASYAISLYADFNGDMLHDPSVDVVPGSSIIASIYVSQTATELANNGGLNGFGVDMITGGLPVLGNDAGNIVIDPQWNFATSTSIDDPTLASVRAIGNTLTPGGFADGIVHLFDITLDVPNVLGATYNLNFADIPGDSFVSNNFFVYDDFVVFAESQVNAVPVPAAVWLMMSGVVALVGIGRRSKVNK